MKNRFLIIPMVCMLALSLIASTPLSAAPAETNPLEVTVSILPQKYFVERIGGDNVKVNVMVLPGESPATYEPSPDQMTTLGKSTAYISIGVPFEKAWLQKFQSTNKNLKMVDTTKGIERMATPDGGFDPHIWLSPSLVKVQSKTIYEALAEIDARNAETYKKNFEIFMQDIDSLDSEIKATLDKSTSKKFLVFHPAWGYFARDYGLEMIAVEVGGQEPSAKELSSLIKRAKDEKIKVVFTQPEFDQKAAETIAKEIDGEVIKISPLNPEWLENLKTISITFANVLK